MILVIWRVAGDTKRVILLDFRLVMNRVISAVWTLLEYRKWLRKVYPD